MEKNVGGLDQKLRIVLGIGLLSMLLWAPDNLKWWGLVGLLPLATGLMRWCPAYLPFGFKTCAKK